MAFVVGSVIIGAGAALGGAAISSKGAKDAAKTAAAGSDKQIAYNRESRDIALDLGSPYREAGYSALDKLGSMTGLIESGGTFGRPSYQGEGAAVTGEGTPWGDSPWKLGYDNGQYTATLNDQKLFWDDSQSQWMSTTGSAYGSGGSGGGKPVWKQQGDVGDWVQGRAGGGVMYNVNELGPESVYSGGAITRSSNPKTMPPDPTGYVHPNIQGRQSGGAMYNPTYDMSEGSYAATGISAPRAAINPGSMGDSIQGRTAQDYANAATQFEQRQAQRPQGGGFSGGAYSFGGEPVGHDPNAPYKGGEFGWRDGIPSGKENMSNNTIDMNAETWNSGTNGGAIYDEGGVPIPQENPYDFTTDPGYQFRLNEGMRALESSAAARGGLLSGGFGRKAIRYGQDYASNEFSNIYNRISNIAGLGQVSAGQGGVFAQNAGAQMGAAAGQGALSSAYGDMAGTNAWSNAFNQIAQLPWDQIQWGGGGATGSGGPKA